MTPNDPRLQQSPEELCEALDREKARSAELARAYAGQLNDRKAFQARLQREQERAIGMAQGKVACDLLDISDEIERALGVAQGDESALAQGVRMIHSEVQKRLHALGVKRLTLTGTRFDPNLAEALEVLPVERPEEDELVIDELRPGFALGDQVIRTARVTVGRYVAPVQAASDRNPSSEQANLDGATADASGQCSPRVAPNLEASLPAERSTSTPARSEQADQATEVLPAEIATEAAIESAPVEQV
jgi:molecular chaperone GrpE